MRIHCYCLGYPGGCDGPGDAAACGRLRFAHSSGSHPGPRGSGELEPTQVRHLRSSGSDAPGGVTPAPRCGDSEGSGTVPRDRVGPAKGPEPTFGDRTQSMLNDSSHNPVRYYRYLMSFRMVLSMQRAVLCASDSLAKSSRCHPQLRRAPCVPLFRWRNRSRPESLPHRLEYRPNWLMNHHMMLAQS